MEYYSLSPKWTTVLGNPSDIHNFQPAHKTRIVEVNKVVDGISRKYLAYDSDPEGMQINLYYTDDLDGSWTAYSGNPILGPNMYHYRWASVAHDGTTFHMFLMDRTDNQIERWTSTDGINFSYQEKMDITEETDYMSPFIWFNPNDNKWYLYHQKWSLFIKELYVRSSSTISGLKTAIDTKVMDDNDTSGEVAAPSIMYRDGYYWLVTEGHVTPLIWGVFPHRSDSPNSGFKECSNSPVVSNDEACPIHILSPDGNKAYLFTSRDAGGGNWLGDTREILTTTTTSTSTSTTTTLPPRKPRSIEVEQVVGQQPYPPAKVEIERVRRGS